MSGEQIEAVLRNLLNDEGGQSAADIVAWLSEWARQEGGAPDGAADWLQAQASVVGSALIRVLDWPRADYGSAWAELRGYLGELAKVGRPVDLDDLRYMDDLHRRALAPVAEWMATIAPSAGEVQSNG